MGKAFNLDQPFRDYYGDREYTFREAIERGELKVEKRNNLETGFKNEYYAVKGILAYHINGNQAKKYVKEQK